MEFKDIVYVCAIAKYKSITKAADALFITQPTLSQYIKNMQKRRGVQLFRYEKNQILLTYEGELFAAEGRKLLRDRDNLINNLNFIQKKGHGLLKLAIALGRGSYVLPEILPKFHQAYPHAKVQLVEGSSQEIITQVVDGFCDIVITNKPSFPASIDYETLWYEKMLLVINRENPLTSAVTYDPYGQAYIRLADCHQAPFIFHQAYQHTGQVERSIFKNAGYKPNIILETKNLEASYLLAARGYGLTFLSEYQINRLMRNNETVNCQILDPITNMELIVGYRNRSELSFLAKEFIRILKTAFI